MTTHALDAAFRATTYRVDGGALVFDLRIGVANPAFDDFLRALDVSCWGLVTADNPGGVRNGENAARRRALLERLRALGWRHLPARHVADDSTWPVESGVLILQVGQEELCALAAQFAQLAVVCGELGSAPRLVWL